MTLFVIDARVAVCPAAGAAPNSTAAQRDRVTLCSPLADFFLTGICIETVIGEFAECYSRPARIAPSRLETS